MTIAIAKLWQLNTQITVTETLEMLRDKFPSINDMSEDHVAQLLGRLNLRPPGGSHTKVDNAICDHIGQLLRLHPTMKLTQLNKLIQRKFPNEHINDNVINQLIRRYKWRPLRGMDKNIDQETVEAIVEMFTSNPRLMLKCSQKMLKQRFPLKPQLDCRTIDKIVKLNYSRLKINNNMKSCPIDDEVVDEIRRIIVYQEMTSVESIYKEL